MAGPTERCWLFDTLAVTLTRVEVRPMTQDFGGSLYASPALSLEPAVCRIDLLESAPGAADRMHWHPTMTGGEPGDRTFEPAMPTGPTAWLAEQLHDVDAVLTRSGMPNVDRHWDAMSAIRASAKEIVDAARDGLLWSSEPWPDVTHDERGMALGGS